VRLQETLEEGATRREGVAGSLTVTGQARRRKTAKPRKRLTAKRDRLTYKGGTAAGQELWTRHQFQKRTATGGNVGGLSSGTEDS
jgi:hypothetical protein